jgi:hypothetical protein
MGAKIAVNSATRQFNSRRMTNDWMTCSFMQSFLGRQTVHRDHDTYPVHEESYKEPNCMRQNRRYETLVRGRKVRSKRKDSYAA